MDRNWTGWAAHGALALGAALVLLALIALSDGGAGVSRADAALRWRLERSITPQEGCLTCHVRAASGPPAAADLTLARDAHDPFDLPEPHPSTPSPDPITVNARLRSAAERLLNLPATDAPDFRAAAEQYLAVVEGARGDHAVSAPHTLRDLAAVETLVRALENKASAVQMRAGGAAPGETPQGAPPGFGPPLLAASLPPRLMDVIAGAARPIALLDALSLSALAVVLVRRRGPPDWIATPEYGWEGRSPLPLGAGDLPFFVAARSPVFPGRAGRGALLATVL